LSCGNLIGIVCCFYVIFSIFRTKCTAKQLLHCLLCYRKGMQRVKPLSCNPQSQRICFGRPGQTWSNSGKNKITKSGNFHRQCFFSIPFSTTRSIPVSCPQLQWQCTVQLGIWVFHIVVFVVWMYVSCIVCTVLDCVQ